jgi:hypothetical protein
MSYYKDTDSLYIDLSEKPSKESLEVAPGIAGWGSGLFYYYSLFLNNGTLLFISIQSPF